MLKDLLPERVFSFIVSGADVGKLTEVRMRTGKPLSVAEYGKYFFPSVDGHEYVVTGEDVGHVLAIATKHSMYAVNSRIANGFLSCDDGIRIGLSGEGVYKNGKLFTLKNVNSLCIRIPSQIFGCASGLEKLVDDFDNTLIISPPGMGKTTLLREMIRLLSFKGKNVVVIDERNELSASCDGVATADLGPNTDVLLFSCKKAGYADAVRSLRPDVIATDEIFGKDEISCLRDICRCGVKVLATVHADGLLSLLKDTVYCELAGIMRYFVELREIGKISALIDKKEYKKC